MRLRTKALLIVGATLTGLVLLSHLAAHSLVMAGFDALEAEAVRQNLERARRALSGEVASLYETTRDYSVWDETYRYAKERNPDYLTRQLLAEGQGDLRITMIAILDLEGALLHGRLIDHEGKRQLPLPSALSEQFVARGLAFRDPAVREGRSGVLVLPDREWIVAAWPILDNSRTKPARGTMIMGRRLDGTVTRALTETTRLDIEIRRHPVPGLEPELGILGSGPLVRPLSEEQIAGHTMVNDITGRPALALTIRMPRTIHERARNTLAYFTISLLVIGVMFGLSMIVLIERVVLSRIARLAASLHALRERGNLASRVDASGRDEVSKLGESINTLLTTVEAGEERLRHEASFDALTGLPNRAMLLDLLRRAVARARRHPQPCGLLFVDVDRFKYVNDSLGHAAGDELLRELARRLVRCVRPEDTVARLAGDEFVVLLDGLSTPADATRVAERIQGEVGRPVRLGESETFASVSIGIAIGTGEEQPEELLRAADLAMYRAKALGRAGHQVFDRQMQADATSLLNLEHNLRHALERSEFEVHYQPIVELEGSKIVGFEALVRWRHPTRGLVSPSQFIPLAEETGLIVSIGHWVLDRALSDALGWAREFSSSPPLTMSVNLSPRQLVEADLCEKVDAVLTRTGFDCRRLHLEITENAIMRRPDYVTVVLGQLKDLGVEITIDDFGTGYSSLSYLHRFPVDFLKIDRSFVSSMHAGGKQRRIVETIVLLATNLGIGVIAEGVESDAQRLQLLEFGCVLGQGYHFSRPVDAQGVHGLLAAGGALVGLRDSP